MARNFDGVDDVLNALSPAILDNVNTFTYTAWVYPRTMGENSFGRVCNKAVTTNGKRFFMNDFDITNGFAAVVERDTTDMTVISNADFIVLNTWQLVILTYNETDGGKLFRGTPAAAVAEVTYFQNTIGGGATTSDAAGEFMIGNRPDGTRTFDGLLADMRVYNVNVSLPELDAIRFGHIPQFDALVGWWPLCGRQSPEPDRTQYENAAAVTGALEAEHPEIIRRQCLSVRSLLGVG